MTTQHGTDAPVDAVVGFDPELVHDAIVEESFAPIEDPPPPEEVERPVWVSSAVPGYHVSSQCSALLFEVVDPRGRRSEVHRMTHDDAEAAGLKMCRWCAAWRQMLTA